MAVFKCKMCGANLNISENDKVCTCEYCGSTQTVPSIISDQLEGMYQRANQFRMNYDFDKAISLFEDDDISGDIEWDTPDIIEVSEDE